MRCLMFGNYWRGKIRLNDESHLNPAEGLTPFVGVIELDENGGFTGTVSDMYGEADVQGTATPTALEFRKWYTYVRPGKIAGNKLYYLLRGSAVGGGWWGMYTQDGEDTNTPRGQAICTIHPDPNA